MDFTPYLGLSRTPSACDADEPDGIVNDSDATLVYLDDVPELPLARLSPSWVRRDEARRLASNTLNSDLKAFLGSAFQSRPLYNGLLGKNSYTQFPLLASASVSLPLHMRYLRGGTLLIRSIGMILSQAVSNQEFSVYREGEPDPILTHTIPAIGERSTAQYALPEAWRIPMDGNRYEIRTTLPDGVKVADNPLACGGCGGMGALMGMITNCCTGKASGFLLTLGGLCDYDPLLAQLMENDRSKLVVAYMLAYQAGYILCARPDSGQIERSTLLSETDIATATAACQSGYLNRLNWLRAELPNLNLSAENTCFQAAVPYSWSRTGAFRH